MKKFVIVLLLVAITAQGVLTQEQRAAWDFYGRLSTGLCVSDSESIKLYDWTVGLDLGVGIRFGSFHAGAAAGIRTQALLIAILALLASSEGNTYDSDPVPSGEIKVYLDLPVRIYSGFNLSGEFDSQLDVFFGKYIRFSTIVEAPRANDFEAGALLLANNFFIEASYIWPQIDKIRFTLGFQLGRW